MKNLRKLGCLFFALTILVSCSEEQESIKENLDAMVNMEGINSVAEAIEAGIDIQDYLNSLPKIEMGATERVAQRPENNNLQFIFNPEDFPCSGDLPMENFDNANRNFSGGIPVALLDENSDFLAFSPGGILPGISFEIPNNYGDEYPMYLWTESNYIADKVLFEHSLNEGMNINITSGNVTSVSMDVYSWKWYSVVEIDIYGKNGFLGSSSVEIGASYGSNYWGVLSEEPITKIVLTNYSMYGSAGIDNIAFGNCDDIDGDGCLNDEDAHPYSNLSETVIIDGCDTEVENTFAGSCGTTMMDEIDDLIAEISAKAQEPRNRYQRAYKAQAAFKTGMYFLLAKWQSTRYITRSENSAIMKCVGRSSINFKGDEPR